MTEILINNKKYNFPLEDETQNDKIIKLAKILDTKIKELKQETKIQSSEDLLLIQAILLLDEIDEIKILTEDNEKCIKIIEECKNSLAELNNKN